MFFIYSNSGSFFISHQLERSIFTRDSIRGEFVSSVICVCGEVLFVLSGSLDFVY